MKIRFLKIVFIIIMFLITNNFVYATGPNVGIVDFKALNSTNSKPISDLEINIYQIGKTVNGKFIYNDNYKNLNMDLSNLNNENLIDIKQYAEKNDNPAYTKKTNSDGIIKLNNLDLGIYLIVQSNKFDEIDMQTMLIKIPEENNDKINYEISVKPKIVNIENKQNESINDKIPYTGTLNWLVPVFAILAIIILCIGWIVIYLKKNKKKVK